MFGLGFPELLLIFVIALVVFGPKKLPEMGRSIGRALAEFKKASEEFQESIKAEMKEVEKASPLEELKKIGQDTTGDAAKQASAPETAPAEQDKEKEKKENVDGNV
jgi:sec-independent protein translocase protein TatA